MVAIKHISIPQPCNQSWQEMEENEQGRHCVHCAKTVIDFSKMSNDEILVYLACAKNVCGRFDKIQLDEVNDLLKTTNGSNLRQWKKWLIAAGLIGVAFTERAAAQNAPMPKVVQSQGDTSKKSFRVGEITISGVTIFRDISGTVLSADDGLSIPGATVQVKGNNKAISTDIKGHFVLRVSGTDTLLTISSLGFIPQEAHVPQIVNPRIDVVLKPLLNEPAVVVGGIVTKRKPFYKRWYYRFIKKPLHDLFN